MNNTALRAEKEIANTIIFRNEKHKDFYQTYMKKCRRQDVYHKALIYCLGISEDTRVNIDRIYDLRTGYVKTECLQEGWQTSGSVRIVRMAFNLYCNGTPSVYDYESEDGKYRSMQDIHRRSYFAVGMRDTFGRQSKFVIRNIAFRGEEAC